MPSNPLSPAQLIRAARHRLDALLADDLHDAPLATDVVNVAKAVQLACAQNRHVALAQILIDQRSAYPARHACDVATVVDLALAGLGRARTERLPVVAAALTMNIGMQALQTTLASQTTPLTPEQRETMQQHPQHSRDLLRLRGVADTLWLDCVLQHHEAPDGSGYPQQLHGDAIRFEARLLGLADRYCALLTQSAWRHAQHADAALKQSLADGVDAKLARLFTETVGVFPPGATVTLANGETAIVRETGPREDAPAVVAYLDRFGQTLSLPVPRDTALPAYRIHTVVDTATLALGANTIWGRDAV
ncbi:HD-GYP domain-containing protein [Jeongeupia chitinilytica]|uniref:HD-GYP domain-containing protein n=1 Tax=Jeongeupia chitinilytica TaxID=1041641 RepID=A0ABQ3GW37_9NEIS|nr:HD domain-containing phosphohydrolase [Jeongeupia chitinilytica]GHD55144.1 hypothetical protein GCM10007350_00390 [Jeongeupia chitinilytica]